ncbi:triphosphoribosyl-dephospho-CoA synthase [Segnochrobactrum spirostomi]|uniref:Triphosphoribosyl-dephospho-CoA synthase n=1 Tax=Segnochrobactrum spirostomi TaxID=2608987 RepID=A0A6A7Y031_9HYPH|nr:triphosphoribosyl-dephospho-CoA synthase [Segnochrobactrum spirostomi]MQT11521.1 triphosphoribosyl-dephospho-CoA synthase [Segnochrobactrum spirostomi]
MSPAASSVWIADAFRAACRDELAALKPGNVHRHADGHRMTIADFEASADAAAPAIAESGARVGLRILAAVEATFAAVGTNTNLGIVLLAAPLAVAAERGPPGSLRDTLPAVLSGLDRRDAALAFRAIARANPAGLGRTSAHDVHDEPAITLLAAMEAAAERDRIAQQYASRYEDIFATGLPALAAALGPLRPWEVALDPATQATLEAATTAVHMAFLTAFPDSHIARKHGIEAAAVVQREAARLVAEGRDADHAALLAFDASLKARGLNPGTTADLTVTTLFAARLGAI